MPDWLTGPDMFLIAALALVALVLAAGPILDARHEKRKHLPGAQIAMFRETMAMLWLLAIVSVLGWFLSGRSFGEIGFAPVAGGWQGLAAWAITGLILIYSVWQLIQTFVSARARASVREQIGEVRVEFMRPRTRSEAVHFQFLSVTAGITEEIVFRGVLIAAFALVMPLWLAVALSLIAFTLPHAYQGPIGMARVLPTGAVLTAIFLLGGSLWPAMLAHAVIDMTAGLTFAILDRFEDSDRTDDGSEGEIARDTAALKA